MIQALGAHDVHGNVQDIALELSQTCPNIESMGKRNCPVVVIFFHNMF